MSDQNPTAHPLSWPVGWKRTKTPERSRFGTHSMANTVRKVIAELGRMNCRDWEVVISTNVRLRQDGLPYSNQKNPGDPGAAVYFRVRKVPHVLACDKWRTPEENLWAIAKHIEALRGQERWGVGAIEQAFAGYARLPEGAGGEPWHSVLGVTPGATKSEVRQAYSRKVKSAHPDHGGTSDGFQRIKAAYDQFQNLSSNGRV